MAVGAPALSDDALAEMLSLLYPDGTRILELSTKCAPGEAFQVAAEARAFLTERGIKTTGAQTTKTRKALQYFSKQSSRA